MYKLNITCWVLLQRANAFLKELNDSVFFWNLSHLWKPCSYSFDRKQLSSQRNKDDLKITIRHKGFSLENGGWVGKKNVKHHISGCALLLRTKVWSKNFYKPSVECYSKSNSKAQRSNNAAVCLRQSSHAGIVAISNSCHAASIIVWQQLFFSHLPQVSTWGSCPCCPALVTLIAKQMMTRVLKKSSSWGLPT